MDFFKHGHQQSFKGKSSFIMIKSIHLDVSDTKLKQWLTEFTRGNTFTIAILFTIVLVGIGMRFFRLGEWGFWIDEVLEINYAAEAMQDFPSLTRLSLLLTGSMMTLLGTSEWTARLGPALVGMLSLVIFYIPIKKMFGTAVAILSILLLAVSPWHLYWSQNARFYTTLLLFYSLCQFAFYYWLETDRLIYLLITGVLLGLAVLERMVAAFFIPVAATYLLMFFVFKIQRPAGFRKRNFVLVAVPVVVVALYVLWIDFFSSFAFNILGYQFNPVRVLLSFVHDVGLPVFILALAGGLYLTLEKNRLGIYIFLGAVVPLVLLLMIAPFAQTVSRYIFVTLLNWIILAAFALREIAGQLRKQSVILAASVLLVLIADSFSQDMLYYVYQNGNREDYKGAFAVVERSKQEGDVVITTRPEIGRYYLDEAVLWNGEIEPEDVARSGERTWFVVDNRSFITPELTEWLNQNAELASVNDVYVAGKPMLVRVYFYQPDESRSTLQQ